MYVFQVLQNWAVPYHPSADPIHPSLSPLMFVALNPSPSLLAPVPLSTLSNRDDADLYDAFGNYLGGDLDSGSDSGSEAPLEEQDEQQPPLRAYDEDEDMAQEPLEGMEVDGECDMYRLSWLLRWAASERGSSWQQLAWVRTLGACHAGCRRSAAAESFCSVEGASVSLPA